MRDVSVEFAGRGTAEQANRPVKSPAMEARPLPSWGIYARQVGELVLDGVHLRLAAPDARPAVRCERVGRLIVDDLRPDPRDGGGEAMMLENVNEVVNGRAKP